MSKDVLCLNIFLFGGKLDHVIEECVILRTVCGNLVQGSDVLVIRIKCGNIYLLVSFVDNVMDTSSTSIMNYPIDVFLILGNLKLNEYIFRSVKIN